MKKYTLLVCLFLCFLASCAIGVNTSAPDVQKQKELTTLEIQEKTTSDTVLYKVFEKGHAVYLINPKTNTVQKTVDMTYDGTVTFIIVIIFILIIVAAFCAGSGAI